MTAKQILDSFSETLMQDERILSAQERALLTTLLQHARAASNQNPETQAAVKATIASAVGETVAQRAFAVLGGSIVERILDGSGFSTADSSIMQSQSQPQPPTKPRPANVPPPPQPPTSVPPQPPTKPQPTTVPPGPPPQPPTSVPPGPPPQPPTKPQPTVPPGPPPQPPTSVPPGPPPQPPTSVPPQPPTRVQPVHSSLAQSEDSKGSVATMERPAFLPAQCVVLDEFLAPQELEELTRYVLEHEIDFRASTVVSASSGEGVLDYEYRRSRVLDDIGKFESLLLERMKPVLPQVLQKLGMEEFPIREVESQITASNDGDFFLSHTDDGSARVASRRLTFVYFFHREPKPFEGGELRIHDASLAGEHYLSTGSYQNIVPRQNQIVFFPCSLLHELTRVECPSQLFADSRFTLNGWLLQ